ncbi:MAG: MBL fold metallo-hydrolase [Bacillota bacterium]
MSKILIKVLGTAQDGGYPQPNCFCPNCIAAKNDKSLIRYPSSLGILDINNKESYIIDPTPHFPEQLQSLNKTAQKYNFSKNHLKGVFLTHAHIGHYTGLIYFGKEAINYNKLNVYTSKSMKDFLIKNQPWQSLIENENINISLFKFNNNINKINNFQVKAIKVPHRAEYTDTASFLIKGKNKTLFYLPDIDSWKKFRKKFNQITLNSDLLLIDGTFFHHNELTKHRDRNIKNVPHPTIKKTIIEIKKGKLKLNNSKLFFTHFNHTNKILNPQLKNKSFFKKKSINILEENTIFEI